MPDGRLDAEGRIVLPAGVRQALGWDAEQELNLIVDGDQILVQPATRSTSLKDEARRLAAAMRDLTVEATRRVAEKVASVVEPAPGSSGPGSVSKFHGLGPQLGEGVYLAPGSTVIGDVTLGADVSIWPGVVVRGDIAPVRVGARSNVQDGAVLHVSPHAPCVVGSGVTIGHQAGVHACTVADNVLIGIHAVVLDGAKIGEHTIIAAGAVVPPGMDVPSGKMVMGVPARVVRDLTPEEIVRIHWNADSYVRLKAEYLNPTPVSVPTPPEAPPGPAPPQRGSLPRCECRRAAGPIVIDGSLDDPGWAGIAPMSPLVHSNGGGHPVHATEVKACWDDTSLYLAFACRDTDVWGNFANRDDPLYEEEAVEAFLCPSGDLRHYFEIEVSPCNVLFDAKVFNPDGDRATMLVDKDWNAARIRTEVRVSGILNDRTAPDFGWIAEMAIPFTDLGLSGPPAPGTVWRANFYRIERSAETEFTAWSPTYREPADFHVPACFGEIVFVGGEEEAV